MIPITIISTLMNIKDKLRSVGWTSPLVQSPARFLLWSGLVSKGRREPPCDQSLSGICQPFLPGKIWRNKLGSHWEGTEFWINQWHFRWDFWQEISIPVALDFLCCLHIPLEKVNNIVKENLLTETAKVIMDIWQRSGIYNFGIEIPHLHRKPYICQVPEIASPNNIDPVITSTYWDI